VTDEENIGDDVCTKRLNIKVENAEPNTAKRVK